MRGNPSRDIRAAFVLWATQLMDFFIFFFRFFFHLTVIPGPPLFPLTVQLLDPFPCSVEFIKDIQ